jgi:hypothetical protein
MATDTNPLDAFDTDADCVEAELSDDDLLTLCGNGAWRIVHVEAYERGHRVKAIRVKADEPRMPYRDD